ncbi:hypothetical protein AX14_013898 [Amanita brunnescens Koide BX004]|jgi:hypothetical protein|nr:hypothetical protein AX14_013898 [Amanita brunnescens Koide BX004]
MSYNNGREEKKTPGIILIGDVCLATVVAILSSDGESTYGFRLTHAYCPKYYVVPPRISQFQRIYESLYNHIVLIFAIMDKNPSQYPKSPSASQEALPEASPADVDSE